jgi:hypothetical protein
VGTEEGDQPCGTVRTVGRLVYVVGASLSPRSWFHGIVTERGGSWATISGGDVSPCLRFLPHQTKDT